MAFYQALKSNESERKRNKGKEEIAHRQIDRQKERRKCVSEKEREQKERKRERGGRGIIF